jgi:hypothetical protein
MDVSVRLRIHLHFRLFLVSWFQKNMRDYREEKVHIDSYQFGKIVIDGMAYESDCLIVDDSIDANWWRKQGHVLDPEDLQPVIEARPAVLVVGCGSPGLMKVSKNTRQVLQQEGIELVALNTDKAVMKFNELTEKGENVAAALHLTC